jgi:hypothetical protein
MVLPVLVKVLRKAAASLGKLEKAEEQQTWWQRFVAAAREYAAIGLRYVLVLLAAAAVAVALVFLLDLKFAHARDAVLAGIAWESLVNKIFGQGGKPAS